MRVVRGLLAGLVLTSVIAGVAVASSSPMRKSIDGPFAADWILVKLEAPLPRTDDGTFALRTGAPALDAAISDAAVLLIAPAFAVSSSATRDSPRLSRFGLDRVYRFHVPAGSNVREVCRRFENTDGVDYAEPDYVDTLQGTVIPNDPEFPNQWGLDQVSDADVDAPEAWAKTTGSSFVIAVIDSGVDLQHPEMADHVVQGIDIVNGDNDQDDDQNHGTAVASIAAVETDEGVGMAGVCWGCKIMPVKTFNSGGETTVSDFVDGVIWAVDHGAHAINYSAGGEHSLTRLSAVQYAYDAGVTFIASTGNFGGVVAYPARYGQALAVGGTDDLDELADFSATGREVDFVGPAVGIVVALNGGANTTGTGTSFSAPFVAGLAGLAQSVHPSLGREELRQLIAAGSEDQVGLPAVDFPGWDESFGWGRINLDRTVSGALAARTLVVEGKASTRLRLTSINPLATTYDFIRGDLSALSESALGVELGNVVCLENNSPNNNTFGNEDSGMPASGEGFFYLARFNAGEWNGSYGGSTEHRDRLVPDLTPTADQIVNGLVPTGEFAVAAAAAGDVNGDGYDDVIVGASLEPTAMGIGAAYVFLGSETGLVTPAAWVIESAQDASRLGFSVDGAGDVNGDGYDDVIVGEFLHDGTSGNNEGRALVYLGSASGLETTVHRELTPGQGGARFGFMVAGAGDVDADGYDDVIVGAQRFDNGNSNEGEAQLFSGSGSGLGSTPTWTFGPDQTNAWLSVVGAAGDVNNDGYDDIVVGAYRYDTPTTDAGRAWVFTGSATGPGGTPNATLDGSGADSRFGFTVSGAGDVDNDGYDEVVIGAQRFTNGEFQEGGAFLYHGSSTGTSATASWSYETDQILAQVALAGSVGDMNGDGYDEVAVGSSFVRRTRLNEGTARIFYGSAGGPSSAPDWEGYGLSVGAELGSAVAIAGDVNGDGFADLLIGSKGFDVAGGLNEGRLLIYHGSGSGIPAPAVLTGCEAIP